jgi:hypothetical protein
LWIALVLLVVLAGIEAALALMRDMLIADDQALRQSLRLHRRRRAPTPGSGISRPGPRCSGSCSLPLAFVAIRSSPSCTRRARWGSSAGGAGARAGVLPGSSATSCASCSRCSSRYTTSPS